MAKKKPKKKTKTKVRVKRYVTITKTVVKSGKDTKPSKKTAQSNIIGKFIDVKFQVEQDKEGNLKMLTMSDVGQEVSAEWEEHRIIGRKFPKMEFIGASQRTFTMTIVLDRQFGQNPHGMIAKLNKYCETGKVGELNIGSHKIGRKWYIQSVSQTWDTIYSKGQLTKATLNLTLGLYD